MHVAVRTAGVLCSAVFSLLTPLEGAQAHTTATANHHGSLESVLQEASARKLHDSQQWLALGHYQPSLFGLRSIIDSKDFFLSEVGASDPEAELAATLQAMFQPLAGAPDEHPQCRFPARFLWLNAVLTLDDAGVEHQSCPIFEERKATLDAGGVTFVFSAALVSEPASMFGHTLLRLDPPEGSTRPALASYAVNYGADAGPLYAVKGLLKHFRLNWLHSLLR